MIVWYGVLVKGEANYDFEASDRTEINVCSFPLVVQSNYRRFVDPNYKHEAVKVSRGGETAETFDGVKMSLTLAPTQLPAASARQ